jgi:hypothetical protein
MLKDRKNSIKEALRILKPLKKALDKEFEKLEEDDDNFEDFSEEIEALDDAIDKLKMLV